MVENYKSVCWERVLYRKFNYPDNYCDKMKFLKLLKRNGKNFSKKKKIYLINF